MLMCVQVVAEHACLISCCQVESVSAETKILTTKFDAVLSSTQQQHADIGIAQAASLVGDSEPHVKSLKQMDEAAHQMAQARTRIADLKQFNQESLDKHHKNVHQPPMQKFKQSILQQQENARQVLNWLSHKFDRAERLKEDALKHQRVRPALATMASSYMTPHRRTRAGSTPGPNIEEVTAQLDSTSLASEAERAAVLAERAAAAEAAVQAAATPLPKPHKPKWALHEESITRGPVVAHPGLFSPNPQIRTPPPKQADKTPARQDIVAMPPMPAPALYTPKPGSGAVANPGGRMSAGGRSAEAMFGASPSQPPGAGLGLGDLGGSTPQATPQTTEPKASFFGGDAAGSGPGFSGFGGSTSAGGGPSKPGGASLFGATPASTEPDTKPAAKAEEAVAGGSSKALGGLFSGATKNDTLGGGDKGDKQAGGLFGAASSTPAATAVGGLFGAKKDETPGTSDTLTTKPASTSIFGAAAPAATPAAALAAAPAGGLFGNTTPAAPALGGAPDHRAALVALYTKVNQAGLPKAEAEPSDYIYKPVL